MPRSLRICHICNEYPFEGRTHGGVGTWVQNISRRLVGLGHQVTVIGIYPSAGVVDDQGVRVVKIARSRFGKLSPLVDRHRMHIKLRQLARSGEIDLIELYEANALLLPSGLGVPVVIRLRTGHNVFAEALRGTKKRLWRSLIEKYYVPKADFLAAVASFGAEANRRLLGLGNRTIRIIPNFVDATCFSPAAHPAPDKNLILCYGTLNFVKGISELICAMPQIISACSDAHLAVVGRDTEDRLTGESFLERLKREIRQQDIQHVHFAGWIPHKDVANYIFKAAVCVFPSKIEGCPNAWLEAMACGKPVVASKTGPGPEIIEDGVSGLLCDPWDPKDIAEKVIRVLEDPELAERLGRNARKRVEEHFSAEVIVPKNIAFYEECIERFKRGETDRQRTFWRL